MQSVLLRGAAQPRNAYPACQLDDVLILQVTLHRIIVGPLRTPDSPLELGRHALRRKPAAISEWLRGVQWCFEREWNPFHCLPEPPDEAAPLPLLSTSFSP